MLDLLGLPKMIGGMSSCGGGCDSDAKMISKALSSLSGQADELRMRMECHGTPLPSWAEYKVYKAHDAIKDALSSTFGDRHKSGPMNAMPKGMMIVIRKAKKMGEDSALEHMGMPPKEAEDRARQAGAEKALQDYGINKKSNAALVQQGIQQGLTPGAAHQKAYPPQQAMPKPMFTVNKAM